ncbi:MAG TPA: hypothetical protein VMJ10_20220 [Kofleriaceae bacterium]|nr:hypothetical protein [Kofleriaceae bacterium]
MSGPKRNPDKLNTIGVVVVGICGAVLVYVTIVALEAFYVNDTSEIQTIADYGGQETTAKTHKAAEIQNIGQTGKNQAGDTFHIPIDIAMKKVVESANGPNGDPSHLVPALPPATKATIQPVFGRPKVLSTPPPPAAAGSGAEAGSAAAPAAGSAAAPAAGSAAAPAPAAGSAAAPAPAPAPAAAPAPAKAPGAGSAAGAHGH